MRKVIIITLSVLVIIALSSQIGNKFTMTSGKAFIGPGINLFIKRATGPDPRDRLCQDIVTGSIGRNAYYRSTGFPFIESREYRDDSMTCVEEDTGTTKNVAARYLNIAFWSFLLGSGVYLIYKYKYKKS